jgi:hypothetical protein
VIRADPGNGSVDRVDGIGAPLLSGPTGGAMDFAQLMTVLRRRWYVVVPAAALVVLIAAVMALAAPRPYESTGTVVLTEPATGGTQAGTSNPLFSFDDSLTTTSQLLVQSLNSPTAIQALAAIGASATYTADDGMLQGPFIVVTADSPSPTTARNTVSEAFRYVEQQLAQRQRSLGAPTKSFIGVKEVVAPTPATLKIGGKSRFAGVVVVLALVAGLTAAFMTETYAERRRRRTPVPA